MTVTLPTGTRVTLPAAQATEMGLVPDDPKPKPQPRRAAKKK